MLLSLFVVDRLDLRVSVFLLRVKVILKDEFAPNLHYLLEKCLCLVYFSFLFEQLTHVIVRRAHAVQLRAELNALSIDAFCQVFSRLLL